MPVIVDFHFHGVVSTLFNNAPSLVYTDVREQIGSVLGRIDNDRLRLLCAWLRQKLVGIALGMYV